MAQANNISTEPAIYTLLVDGNSLLKMCLVDKKMNEGGQQYGGVFQFLFQLQRLLLKKDFNFCYVFYDGYKSGQLRYQYYPDYKANRDKEYEDSENQSDYDKALAAYCRKVIEYHKNNKKPVKRQETDDEAFDRQRTILQQILDELFVRQAIFDECEGDDLIAYYIKHKKDNEKIVIVSGDRDLTQLIRDDVCIYIPAFKRFITPANSKEFLGMTYENILLKKILCGDSSDNIKGVKGLGETTLLKLFPDMKEKKMSLGEVIEGSKHLLEERKQQKKKPLKVLENIVSGVTEGCQGEKLYEINQKIIDLSEPLLTKEAIDGMEAMMYAPLDPEGREMSNVYSIIKENGMSEILDEKKFGSLFGAFERLIKMEKTFFKKNI